MTKFRLIFFLFVVCFQNVNAQSDYPILTEIVTDNAGLFSESETLQLRQKLTDYETRTTHQIVVLTINDLGNDTVETYALQTFNREGNKLGQAEVDNGILILVAKNDRKFRIEVGDGLTPIITDALSSRINRNYITPAFKEGDYFKGINEATSQIIKIIDDPIYAEEFANMPEHAGEPVSLTTKIISSIFLTAFFFVMGVLGYNHLIAKEKRKKISIKRLFLDNKTKFFSFWTLAISIATYFNKYVWYALLAVIIIAFFSVFIVIGFFVILKGTYQRAVKTFTSLFTGKLGVFIFPLNLPVTLLLFLAGFIFSFMPIFMGFIFLCEMVFNIKTNDILSGLTPIHILYVFISILVLFFIITGFAAYNKIKRDVTKSFGFSFFEFDKTFFKNLSSIGSSRGYSSSRSSYSSSSSSRSSSSSFSGGGGRSSGGGSSGSW